MSHTPISGQKESPVTTATFAEQDAERVNTYVQYNSAAEEYQLERAMAEHDARKFTEDIRYIERLEHINHIDALHQADMVRERLINDHGIPMSVIDVLINNIHDLVAPIDDIPF